MSPMRIGASLMAAGCALVVAIPVVGPMLMRALA